VVDWPVTFWRRLLFAVVSFMFPGVGHGLVNQRVHAVAWIVVGVLSPFAMLIDARLTWGALALRVLGAVATFVQIGKPAAPPSRDNEPPAAVVAGREVLAARPQRNRPLAIAAVVIAVIAGGATRSAIEVFRIPTSSMLPTIRIGDEVIVNKLALHLRGPRRGDVVVFRHPCTGRVYIERVVALGGQTVEIRCHALHVDGKRVPEKLVRGTGCSYRDTDASGEPTEHLCTEYEEAGYRTFHPSGRAALDATGGMGDEHTDFPRLDAETAPSCASSVYEEEERPAEQTIGRLVQTRGPEDAKPCDLQLHYVVPANHVFALGDHRSNSNDSRFWGSVPVENLVGVFVGSWRNTL
jgi:signal peptidase I